MTGCQTGMHNFSKLTLKGRGKNRVIQVQRKLFYLVVHMELGRRHLQRWQRGRCKLPRLKDSKPMRLFDYNGEILRMDERIDLSMSNPDLLPLIYCTGKLY
ncbi:uncharacterized protein LOC124927849 [Impatiens glandulifera]|uniref:uncharacterized protein LOC124927849 n=1 Tax=Impatiens glandulifera TaxID=253017 RepID=UPI001FB07E22|nr:uncharacterized protein LOC124927849 [Impatiens glandulifera]XP_047324289.1 uncharacterized protein LOC124927849 [Impatiens glandulifera]XP_047324290.1 uncharacterized protein LOC124927849 [Impatiens glandulifera]XP_047324291.1 uncharacterized protein LOC124927849 [Impatiens glandulifera]XP_047324292.1 uncharacterized protein LOC124927849 [Impatiens glandulifera]